MRSFDGGVDQAEREQPFGFREIGSGGRILRWKRSFGGRKGVLN